MIVAKIDIVKMRELIDYVWANGGEVPEITQLEQVALFFIDQGMTQVYSPSDSDHERSDPSNWEYVIEFAEGYDLQAIEFKLKFL